MKDTVLNDAIGFSHPILCEGARKRRDRAHAELITTAALFVCLAVAVTAVSIGISRASPLASSLAGPLSVINEVSGVK